MQRDNAHLSSVEIADDSPGRVGVCPLQAHRHYGEICGQPLLLLVPVAPTAKQDDQAVGANSLQFSADAAARHEFHVGAIVVIMESFQILDQVIVEASSHDVLQTFKTAIILRICVGVQQLEFRVLFNWV